MGLYFPLRKPKVLHSQSLIHTLTHRWQFCCWTLVPANLEPPGAMFSGFSVLPEGTLTHGSN